jgi:anti-sigma factor RsiW
MIAPHDFDRLSAYLDNQLSPAEKARLEARLEREPELKTALGDLRMTVRALRALPTVKPPRSFTLSPAQARTLAAPRRAFPALRLATALAAFAFVIAVVGDFATNLAQPARSLAVQVTVVAQKSAPATETLVPPAAAAAAAQGVITETQEAAVESAVATPSAADTTRETGTPAIAGLAPAATQGPAESGTAGGGEAPTLPPPTPAPSATEEVGRREAITATATPRPEIVVPFIANSAPAPTSPEAQPPAAAGLPPLRYLEAGLALLTVLLAIAAWIWRGR